MLPVHANGNGSRTTDEDRNISCTLTPKDPADGANRVDVDVNAVT
ncbi:unnamed protein product [Penicillium camemberti]|uniref:Str. FM013 n=1 Tax=Penicillium camemberti (strain FM 013) TaxID=1429867 RepID=A0A0G4PTH2_PENC3|nr:unnamed protein product [Penicillium camemberti]